MPEAAAEFQTALGDAPTDDAPIAGQVSDDSAADTGESVDGIAIDTAPPRTVKSSTRDFARKIAEAHKGKIDESDGMGLAPVIGAPAAPTTLAPAPIGQAAAVPVPSPVAGPAPEVVAAWESVNAERAAIAKQRTELEALQGRVAPLARGKLLGTGEEMHGALSAWLKDELGDGATDADVNEALADVVTELSLRMSGVTLPDSAKLQAEQKRALRQIKRHNRELARAEADVKSKAERAEQTRQRTATAAQVGKELSATAHPYLLAADDSDRDGFSAGEFIVEVVQRAWENDRTKLSWQEAAKRANDYFQNQATAQYGRWSKLLAPPPAVHAAPVGGTLQGDRPVSQVPRTLTNAAASESPAHREPEPMDRFDADEHRRRTAEKWRGKIGRRE